MTDKDQILVESDFSIVWKANEKHFGFLILNPSTDNPILSICAEATESFLYGVKLFTVETEDKFLQRVESLKSNNKEIIEKLKIKYQDSGLDEAIEGKIFSNNCLVLTAHNDFHNYTGSYKERVQDIMPLYLGLITKNENTKQLIINSVIDFFECFRGEIREYPLDKQKERFQKICNEVDKSRKKMEIIGPNNIANTWIQMKASPTNPFTFLTHGLS